ncbi:uncharacterized protein J3R85_000466 [Psidium guajava]|nr:uncharacterized protein J3R85_000466 [Psidium guajava]
MATPKTRLPTSESSGVTPKEEVESELTCYCGLKSPIVMAKTKKNAGRRFHGCAKFNGPGCCDFFMWVDPKISDRARDVIVDLLERNQALSESSQSRREIDVGSLLAEIKTERAENRRLKKELTRVKKEKMLYQMALFCIVLFVMCNVRLGGKFLSLPS